MKLSKLIALGALLVIAVPAMAQSVVPTYVVQPSPAAYQACPTLSANLFVGMRDYGANTQIVQLQNFLSGRYGNQLVTGYFGAMTRANVAAFQREQGVYPVTGGVGPLTRAAIARLCSGTVVPPTQATLSAYPSAGAAPLTVTFTPSQTPGGYFAIDFGDGQSAILQQGSVAHTYTQPGTYVARATSDMACLHSVPQCYTFAAQQSLGSATITVGASPVVGAMVVSSPTQGQVVQNGAQLNINWSAPYVVSSGAYVLELYTSAGAKVGTIAIQSATGSSGSYAWSVPRMPNIYLCTMQYPNGLCGQNLVGGSYYVKVSLVPGTGFDNQPATASAQSGVFSVI